MKTSCRTLNIFVITASLALLSAGCSAVEDEEVPKPSASGTTATQTPATSSSPSSQSPGPSTPAATPAHNVDTSDWKQFAFQNLSFKYPKTWVISAEDCKNCSPETANPYTQWNVITDHGFIVATFNANDASDTDGDMDSYQRTVLERIEHDGKFATDTVFMAERFVSTAPGDGVKTHDSFVMFVGDAQRVEDRGSQPAVSVFHPTKDQYAMFESTTQLPEAVGIDPDDVDEQAAQLILESPEYQQVKAMMLSLETTTAGK
ncbi:hypothetical protein AUR04nite_03820 [Glutamicibacter uratoxydans]|uniref:Lipoprotein n=2 Tax=Glutamicibacter uratoxydans TaxID=43667 RepID=A0A4Y4DML2_GLUUR|nr:hypothetical protein AUR04nite_03820 [Glutamicibacter uratoxydans]